MFGRGRGLDLLAATLLLVVVTYALAVLGAHLVIPLYYTDTYLQQFVLTPDQLLTRELAQDAMQADMTALQDGLWNGCHSAFLLGLLWLIVITLRRPSSPGHAAEMGYVWLAFLVLTIVSAVLTTIRPISALATQPDFIFLYRVLATGWAALTFLVATWIATPSIFVPALGLLGKIRFFVSRHVGGLFSRTAE